MFARIVQTIQKIKVSLKKGVYVLIIAHKCATVCGAYRAGERGSPLQNMNNLAKIGIMCLGTDIAKNPYGVLGTKNYFI